MVLTQLNPELRTGSLLQFTAFIGFHTEHEHAECHSPIWPLGGLASNVRRRWATKMKCV